MKLSSQEEYGLRCLLRLGREGDAASLTISELSQREGISAPNVAKLMRVLRRGGYVRSTRGKEGGYSLARPAEEINLGEALAVLGGRLYDPAFCGRHSGVERLCTHMPDCSIRSVWRLVQGAVDQVLGRLSLRDLLCSEEQMSGWKSPHAVALPMVPAAPES
jgi:Rrf2 family protein